MPTSAAFAKPAEPSIDEVRRELDRLLEDPAFRRAPTHSRLLRYLVERKTSGDDGALCEAGIAMAVFQRDPAAYDSEVDPIVRVNIGRLRERLEKHYQRFERAPSTVILLPRGRYAPEFRRLADGASTGDGALRGLAVMRTSNLTADPALEAIAHSLSERLSEALVLMRLPRVLAATAALPTSASGASPQATGRELGVSEVLETTLSCESAQRLRVSARLLRVADSELAWAEVRTTSRDNAFAGIDALVDAVLARFSSQPGMHFAASVTMSGPPSRAELPAAARGMIESARMLIAHLSLASIDEARRLLREITTDYPGAADAWALRGRSCVRRLNFGDVSPKPLLDELKSCISAALALNRDHLDARALDALVTHWSGLRSESESRYREVLSTAPNHSNARMGLGWLLVSQGRFDDGLEQFDVAASFDPLSLNIVLNRAWVLSLARRYDEARLAFETGLRAGSDSQFALMSFAANELRAGDIERAEILYRTATERHPDSLPVRLGLANVAAVRGDRDRAHTLAAEARASTSTGMHCALATLDVLLGDHSSALAQLHAAFATMESTRLMVGVDEAYQPLANDPEFVTLLRQLGLSQWSGAGARSDQQTPPRA